MPATADKDGLFDSGVLGVERTHLVSPAGEHLLLRTGARMVRLDLRTGTLLEGPVLLRFAIEGMRDLGHKLMTLRRLVGLRRLGRLPSTLFPPERRARRWIMTLRALDGRDSGASHRDLAEGLFGADMTRSDWRSGTDYLRLRVQRLARLAERLRHGGYRDLLNAPSPI